jgi:hypothetical protein
VYEEYFKYHSPLTYILTIFDYIDWSLVHDIKNTGVGRTGYSPVSMIKALLFKTIKKIHSIRELINELYSNPYLAQIMGFDPIRNYVPSESTFSNFRKSFHINIIYSIITDLLFRGISDGFISTDLVIVDSFPIPFDSHFNNPKSFNNFSDDFSTYYSTPLDADFGLNLLMIILDFMINTEILKIFSFMSVTKVILFLFLISLFLLLLLLLLLMINLFP